MIRQRLEGIFARRLEDVLKTSWKSLEYVLKTSWRHMGKTNILVLIKTSSEDEWLRRIYSPWWRRLQDVSSRQMFAGLILKIQTTKILHWLIEVFITHGGISNLHITKINWKFQLRVEMINLTCLMDHILFQTFKTILSTLLKTWNYRSWSSHTNLSK